MAGSSIRGGPNGIASDLVSGFQPSSGFSMPYLGASPQAEVSEVEAAGDAAIFEFAAAFGDQRRLDQLELCVIREAEAIARAGGALFRVRISGEAEARPHRR